MTDSIKIAESDRQMLLDRLCATDRRVTYFPVRHHSPACGLLIRDWIREHRPAAVLIEGPDDYNEHLDELYLGHQLPIAIYSYFRTATDHSGVYYPFCEYSPEWLALTSGRDVGAEVRFIDLPWADSHWADSHGDQRLTHRYADAELRRGRYVEALCQKLHVEDFDDLWDRIIESRIDLTLETYLRRSHEFCLSTRLWEYPISVSDRRREAFMAARIMEALDQIEGRVLVVTGGFHSSALATRLESMELPEIGIDDPPPADTDQEEATIIDRGVALTTYSYERLDGLHGYNAGMPSPGFYRHVFEQRSGRSDANGSFDHRPLLRQLVKALRERKQTLSTADLIAVETTALALASVRGRSHVWRRDLVDAVTSALIKDELQYGGQSPFLDAVYEVLRGSQSGRLADGVRLPPLVKAIQDELSRLELHPPRVGTTIELDLLDSDDLAKSRLLHQLQVLQIRGFHKTGGTDFLSRDQMQRLWERWEIRWSPEFESSCIEAARYGTVLQHAVAAKLVESSGGVMPSAAAACRQLILAVRCGIDSLSDQLIEQTQRLIARESQIEEVGEALGHLLFLYCFDEAFGTTRLELLTPLLDEAFTRSLWLFESLGKTSPSNARLMQSLETIAETFRRVDDVLSVSDVDYADLLARVQADNSKSANVRGAAAGMLWSTGNASDDAVLAEMKRFASPAQLGDFLSGLFQLAREVAQRNPSLVRSIDSMLLNLDGDGFQAALPSLRLAFTVFTPREKHHLLQTLFETLGIKPRTSPVLQTASAETAARALAIEERIAETIRKYGLAEDAG